jgi:polyisoprenoid-binding protein YceI
MSSTRLQISTMWLMRRVPRSGRGPIVGRPPPDRRRIPIMKRLIPVVLAVLVAGCSTVGADTAAPEPSPSTQASSTTTVVTAAETAAMASTLELAPGSEVRFYIFELFRGEPLVVEAINDDVEGSVSIDGDTATAGTFVIEADGFVTERGDAPAPLGGEIGWRDEAIDRFILDVADHPEITFEPDDVALTTGTTELPGVLTVRDISKPVVFAVEITETEDGYAVTGSADVLRSDYELRIPRVAHVAEVADELELQLEFYFEPPV